VVRVVVVGEVGVGGEEGGRGEVVGGGCCWWWWWLGLFMLSL